MLFSEQKLQENIAEYIIYMYQIEDIIRAYGLDVDLITQQFIIPQVPSESIQKKYTEWYKDLIRQMKVEGIEKAGHLNSIKEIYYELAYIHNTLLTVAQDPKYIPLHEAAKDHIEEFRKKSNLGGIHEIEVIFHALYMKMLLKMQKKEISAESEKAFDSMRIMLAYISKAYHEMKAGNLDMFTPAKQD